VDVCVAIHVDFFLVQLQENHCAVPGAHTQVHLTMRACTIYAHKTSETAADQTTKICAKEDTAARSQKTSL
jgi:hypothetical protein